MSERTAFGPMFVFALFGSGFGGGWNWEGRAFLQGRGLGLKTGTAGGLQEERTLNT